MADSVVQWKASHQAGSTWRHCGGASDRGVCEDSATGMAARAPSGGARSLDPGRVAAMTTRTRSQLRATETG
jgi:hypothetical protein